MASHAYFLAAIWQPAAKFKICTEQIFPSSCWKLETMGRGKYLKNPTLLDEMGEGRRGELFTSRRNSVQSRQEPPLFSWQIHCQKRGKWRFYIQPFLIWLKPGINQSAFHIPIETEMDENVQNWDILATESRKPYVISAGKGAFRMDNEHFLVMEFYGMVYRPIKPSAHTHICFRQL